MGENSILNRLFGCSDNPVDTAAQSLAEQEAVAAAESFFDHWNALPKNDGVLPHLRDYLDHPQPDLQPGVAIVDILADGQMNVRLVGTKRAALFGKDLTKNDPMIAFSSEAQKTASFLAKGTVSQPCGNRGLQTIKTSAGNERQSATMTMPLLVDDPAARCFVHFQRLLSELEFDDKHRGLFETIVGVAKNVVRECESSS